MRAQVRGHFATLPLCARADDAARSLRVALEQWVERDTAPATIIATKYAGEEPSRRATMTRPLCPYPQEAKFKGTGDPNDAARLSCVAGARTAR